MKIITRIFVWLLFATEVMRVAVALLLIIGCGVELFRDPWNSDTADRMLAWQLLGWCTFALAEFSVRFIRNGIETLKILDGREASK